jgi:hypothetical protein
MQLPDNLDYKIIHGWHGSGSVSILIFDIDKFEESECEYEAAVFSVEIDNKTGKAEVTVKEDSITQSFTIEDTTPDEEDRDLKTYVTMNHLTPGKIPNCS